MNPEIARRPVAQRLREWLIARCLAPINLDGSQVSEVTIDGQSVREVTMDGDQVFGGAIPDSGDLQARYDATEISASDGDGVSTWADETGNGYGLTAGTAPTFKSSVINGNPVVRFDGVDDFLDVSWSAISQPNHVFMVSVMTDQNTSDGGARPIFDADTNRQFFTYYPDGAPNVYWQTFAGSAIDGGTPDENPHVLDALFNTTSSEINVDGTTVATGDAGTDSMDGMTVGSRYDQASYGAVDVGEILVYPQDKSSVASDVRQYLSDKWGIAL